MKNTVTLLKKTRRLVVRPLAETDYASWKAALSSQSAPQNRYDMSRPDGKALTMSRFRKLLRFQRDAYRNDKHVFLGLFRKKENALLGTVMLLGIVREPLHQAILGYHVYNNHWGNGYATEGAAAALELAFGPLNLRRVECLVETRNQRSLGVAAAIGLIREGTSLRALGEEPLQKMAVFAATTPD